MNASEARRNFLVSYESFVQQLLTGKAFRVWPDAYGTACCAQVGISNCLTWLTRNQSADGSWENGAFLPHRILSTIESAVALVSQGIQGESLARALDFIESAVYALKHKEGETPRPDVELKVALSAAARYGLQLDFESITKTLILNGYEAPSLHSMLRLCDFIVPDSSNPYAQLVYEYVAEEFMAGRSDLDILLQVARRQLDNGSWLSFASVTAKLTQALCGLDIESESRARQWLRDAVYTDGGVAHLGPLDTWCKAMVLFYWGFGELPNPLHKKWLQDFIACQLESGGWGFNSFVPLPDCDDTGVVLRALITAEEKFKGSKKAREFLLNHITPDGGICTYCAIPKSSTDVTLHCISALESLVPSELETCLRFIKRKQNPNGSFPATWHLGPVYSTVHAILELDRFGESDIVNRAVNFIVSAQEPNGGWGTPEETGLALLALDLQGFNGKIVHSGLDYLFRVRDPKTALWYGPKSWIGKVGYSCTALTSSPILACISRIISALP